LGRPDLRPFGLYSRLNAARQAGAAVLSFGGDPARESGGALLRDRCGPVTAGRERERGGEAATE